VARRAMHPRACALPHFAPLLRRLRRTGRRCLDSVRRSLDPLQAIPDARQPMEGPAQRGAEAEPSVSVIPILEQTGVANHKG
jgi:hypothetical protein